MPQLSPQANATQESGIGGSPEIQAAYVKWHIARTAEDPQLMGAPGSSSSTGRRT